MVPTYPFVLGEEARPLCKVFTIQLSMSENTELGKCSELRSIL